MDRPFEMDFLPISFLQSPRFLSWGQKMHTPKKIRDDSEIFRNLQSFKQNRISRITNGDSPAETCPLNSRLYWALESALSRPSRTHAHCLKSNYPPRETPAWIIRGTKPGNSERRFFSSSFRWSMMVFPLSLSTTKSDSRADTKPLGESLRVFPPLYRFLPNFLHNAA